MIRRRGVELGQRRESRSAGGWNELIDVEAADRRDPLARGQLLRVRGDQLLHVGDRFRGLDPRVVARAQPEQHDVIVVVDQPWHRGTALQVDDLGATRGAELAAADRRELVADHARRFHDLVAGIHRVDLAVRQQQVAAASAGLGKRG